MDNLRNEFDLNLAEKYVMDNRRLRTTHLAKYEDTYTGKFGLAGLFHLSK